MTAIDMAILLDGTLPEVQAAGATAREILGRLGARPFLERLESAQRDHRPRARSKTSFGGPHVSGMGRRKDEVGPESSEEPHDEGSAGSHRHRQPSRDRHHLVEHEDEGSGSEAEEDDREQR